MREREALIPLLFPLHFRFVVTCSEMLGVGRPSTVSTRCGSIINRSDRAGLWNEPGMIRARFPTAPLGWMCDSRRRNHR